MPTKNKLQIVYKNVDDLIPYARNAKIHDENNINLIAGSIKSFGFNNPVLLDGENGIIAGHGRVLASKKLGIKQIPTIELQGLSDAEKRAYIIADNRLTEKSEWDKEILSLELQDLNELGIDLNIIGFTDEDLNNIIQEETPEIVEDEFSEQIETPKSVKGDIWILGEHRLMCGDSTSENDVKALMQDEKADLLLTDPPYGVNIVKAHNVGGGGLTHFKEKKGIVGFGQKGKNKIVNCTEYRPIVNDDTTETAKKNYLLIKDYSKNQIIFGGNYFTDFLPPSPCWLVWDKQNTGNFADCELAWASFKTAVRIYRFLWNGLCRAGSREIEGAKRVHPTQKPVGMLADILKDYSKENEIILDCFGGSGSTLIACEQLKRKCRMIEYEPYYIDVIIQRWQKLTNKEAVRIDGVKYNDL